MPKTLKPLLGMVLLALLEVTALCSRPNWSSYQVIIWSTDPVAQDIALWFQRLRELEFTAEQCYRGRDPNPFVQHKFSFYVENLVPQLAFHTTGANSTKRTFATTPKLATENSWCASRVLMTHPFGTRLRSI